MTSPGQQQEGQRRVCMFVYNTFTHDARVHKQASTLAAAGYAVTVVCLRADDLPVEEFRAGYRILRVERLPWHIRAIRAVSSMAPLARLVGMLKRGLRRVFSGAGRLLRIDRLVAWVRRRSERAGKDSRPLGERGYADLGLLEIVLGIIGLPLLPLILLHPMVRERLGLAMQRSTGLRGRFEALVLFSLKAARLVQKKIVSILRRAWRLARALLRKSYVFLVKRPVKLMASWLKRQMGKLLKFFLMPFHRQFCFLDFYARSVDALANERFDVYQAHDLNTMPVAWHLARKFDKPLVYDSHEYYLERNMQHRYSWLGKWLRQRMERRFVRAAAANITVNESIAKALGRQYGVDDFHVIMNTPSGKRFENSDQVKLKEALGIDEGQTVVLYLGAITFNRGLKQAISSMKLLDECHLVLMGPGQPAFLDELKRWAADEGVESKVHFFGPVPSEEVTAYAASADIGIAPIENACLSYYYCSPNKVFEYILSGLPIVASDFPELKKIVSSYDVGLLFDPESPESIARAIDKVRTDHQFQANVINNMDAAARAFNWESEGRKLLDIYEALET
ncbi:MAG: glycosyltransferase [Gammaproteobacteria bacterium]|nr:glycosyltransferase [Gammaproteobacteria bacterium]